MSLIAAETKLQISEANL